MSVLQTIGVAVAGSLLATIIIYVYKVRQLYLTIPSLYSFSEISENGKIVEIVVHNKSWHMEEDLEIIMQIGPVYNMLASSDGSVSLRSNIIMMPRLGPGKSAKFLLLVEQGSITKDAPPQLSSKTTSGKYINQSNDVPPNFGILLSCVLVIIFLFISFLIWNNYEDKRREEQLKKIQSGEIYRDAYPFASSMGWGMLSSYDRSSISKSYGNQEFPVFYNSATFENGILSFDFTVTNKTTFPFFSSGYINARDDSFDVGFVKDYFMKDVKVEPMQSGKLTLKCKVSNIEDAKKTKAIVTIKYGNNETLYLTYVPKKIIQPN